MYILFYFIICLFLKEQILLEQMTKARVISREVLVLGQKLILGKPSNCVLCWSSGFPFNTNLRGLASKLMPKQLRDLQYL